ncbi:MAG TPA: DUF6229 family protein [Micromonosporaceae bacterium]|nr:DUF6229 family protein [Micromonosporaceae bacterium]
MSPVELQSAEQVVARWRSGADADSPAGPLFLSGEYAEADITQSWRTWTISGRCGTACTGSSIYQCC